MGNMDPGDFVTGTAPVDTECLENEIQSLQENLERAKQTNGATSHQEPAPITEDRNNGHNNSVAKDGK